MEPPFRLRILYGGGPPGPFLSMIDDNGGRFQIKIKITIKIRGP